MKLSLPFTALLLAILSPVNAGRIQKEYIGMPVTAVKSKQDVVEIFKKSYDAYKEYAWGHDDLKPVTKGYYDGRNGWGASIVDALTTAQIMGLKEYVDEAIDFSTKIDFSTSKTNSTVSVFETTIRFLGGLLSAYELDGERNPALLEKAKEVADKMTHGWRNESQTIPWGYLNFTTNLPDERNSNIAEAGTLILEWGTLSKHTKNETYLALTDKAMRRIASRPHPLPGLAAQGISPSTGEAVGGYVSWGGGSDSYFEYLIKWARLSNTDDPLYADNWRIAINSTIETLLRRSTVGNHLYVADYDSQRRIRHVSSHLACFHGGNWIMGGRLLDDENIVNIGLELVDGCWNTYTGTATGIGPEGFGFIAESGNFTGGNISPAQIAFYEKHGFYPTSPDYILRPEVLESNFYAWRATGDVKYLRRAEAAIESFNKYLPATVAFAGIENVDDVNAKKIDDMESFWFAEVLKYLYLTFDDPKHINLDEWVFNTEAHPFRAPPAKPSYGSGPNVQPPQKEPFRVRPGPPLPEISANPFYDGLDTPPQV